MENFERLVETCEIDGKTINVFGSWNSVADYEANEDPEFYDVYESDAYLSTHLNEGDPFFEKPTVEDCAQLLKEYYED